MHGHGGHRAKVLSESRDAEATRRPVPSRLILANRADENTELGLESLVVGMKLHKIGKVLGANIQLTVRRGKLFRPLWHVVSQRHEELYEEERRRVLKLARSPNEYVCAAEECDIGLRKEGGTFQ